MVLVSLFGVLFVNKFHETYCKAYFNVYRNKM